MIPAVQNYDFHLYFTKQGEWRARCSGGGITAYGLAFPDPKDALSHSLDQWSKARDKNDDDKDHTR